MNQTTNRKIEIWERVNRADVRANPDKVFIFGDNLAGKGFGGQAKEMRGEENAVGVPTKKAPDNKSQSFFTDKELAENKQAIDAAFSKIQTDKIIVLPRAGIGTGLAQLQEKAPQTFAYLNAKFAAIGFDNRRGEKLTSRVNGATGVVVQAGNEKTETGGAAKRLLDLDDIKTAELKLLSPRAEEIAALDANRERALADYADRLRSDYKENKENLRDGFRRLSNALDKGEQITVACACRNGEMCHADVVKMAIEKVNAHIKSGRESKSVEAAKESVAAANVKTESRNAKIQTNPRTQRAVNEILAVSENDRILANINQTDGRNRSEQASFLGNRSQFVRDIYERGATVSEGKLLVPQENLTATVPLAITTQEFAIKKIGEVLRDESKAKELAPAVVEYGEKISGLTADGETRLKVFAWIYDTLESKNESAEQAESKEERFANALEQIKLFAEEMHSLEPTDKIEFVPLAGEDAAERESVFELADENRIAEEIYENAIYLDENESLEEIESLMRGANGDERGKDSEVSAKVSAERYDRINLSENFPPLPEDFTEREAERFLNETLPEIDRQLENGVAVKEVLKPFNQNVWQSQKDDALNRLEAIYQKQQIAALENKLVSAEVSADQKEKLENEISRRQHATLTPTQEALREMLADRSENPKAENKTEKREPTIADLSGGRGDLSEVTARQIAEINVFRPTVIEIKTPAEFRFAEETSVKTFFQKSKQEIASHLLKLDEIKTSANASAEQQTEAALKKELNQIKESKPSFAFKLENSSEIVVGTPSQKPIDERNFVQFYVNHQLKQPETRLRFENERYRACAARLESATTREAVVKTASEIRAENAAFGMNRKGFEKDKKTNQPRPLTQKEMQFLFTETSPAHYTQAMTVARLAYAHAGASRRLMTESLLRGEISPSPEAQKLIQSLESRLERRKPTDAILATKHFFESIKTSNDALKYKNDYDHREIYRQLPPQEKDFVYERAVRQKENLEYLVVYREQQLNQNKTDEKPRPVLSQAEKTFHLTSLFHQAQILGERVELSEFKSKEISERDFHAVAVLLINHSSERIAMIGNELDNGASIEARKIGEILQTFTKAEISKEENKTQIKITLPENAVLSSDAYRELLEKLYPNDARENDKYKFSSFGERAIEDARTKGQNASLERIGEELKQNVYAAESAPTEVFSIERSIAADISTIAEMQREARRAQRENAGLLAKYAARAAPKIENQNSPALSAAEQKAIVRAALIVEKDGANSVSGKTGDEFFRALQREITLSDFQKFAANEKLINENLSGIKNQFSEISAKQTVLEENKFQAAEARSANNPRAVATGEGARQFEENRLLTEAARARFESGKTPDSENKTIAESIGEVERSEIKNEVLNRTRLETESSRDASNERAAETKPFSLRLYEAEIARAEKELRTKNLGAKILAGVDYSASEFNLNLDKIFSADEREQMKTEAAEIAKSRLEPKELDADHRKIPVDASRQAMATFKQLEQAHNIFQLSSDQAKINEAFSKLDCEAATLNRIRQDYSKAEKIAVLRENVKTDLVDLLRKNQNLNGIELTERTTEILRQNLGKNGLTDFAPDKRGTEILSREIASKIEAKQNSANRENVGLSNQPRQPVERNVAQETEIKMNAAKTHKAKDSFVYAR